MTEIDRLDASKLPLYGALTGVSLPVESFEVLPGLTLRRVYVDMFGTPMLAFAPPPKPNEYHPGPWAAVRGGFSFKCRVEVALCDISDFGGISPSTAIWLVSALLRLQSQTPVRMAALGNMPFDEKCANFSAGAFESAPHQRGIYQEAECEATNDDLEWLRIFMPVMSRLYHDERFCRAFSVYEQSQWSPTQEMGTVLVWTAIETLFDLGGERHKTKAICEALSDYVGEDQSDRNRAYQVIQAMYYKRGRIVHAGRSIGVDDFAQSFQLAKVAFRRILIDGELPPARA